MLTIESTRTCGQTPRLLFLLEELGEPYELVLREEAHFVQTIGRPGPIVRDGDLVFRHALVAFRHFARTRGAGVLMPSDPGDRIRVDELLLDAWMPLGLCVAMTLGLRRAGAPQDVTLAPILGSLRALEAALEGCDFACGDELSAADCALSGIARLGGLIDLSPFPNVARYGARMAARPAFLRATRALAGIATPEQVNHFWFGAPATSERAVFEKIQRWFLAGAELDATIRDAFGVTVEAASRGELSDWAETPRGALALVIVLDQLARHTYRGEARAFAGSDAAIAVALTAIERGDLDTLADPAERSFLTSPLHHAEDLELQRRHESLMTKLGRDAPPHFRMLVEAGVEQSAKWRAIIERFGRFPHRNAVLGRTSTPEELTFLETFASAAPPEVARKLGVDRARLG